MKIVLFLGNRKQADAFNSMFAEMSMEDSTACWVDANTSWTNDYQKHLQKSDYVFLGIEFSAANPSFLMNLEKEVARQKVPFINLQGTRPNWETEVSVKIEELFQRYYRYNGTQNRRNFVTALQCMATDKASPEPEKIPLTAVYSPSGDLYSLAEYLQMLPKEKVKILYLFHREQWLNGETKIIDALLAESKRQNVAGIAMFCQFGALPELSYGGVGDIFQEISLQENNSIDVVVTLQQQSMTGMAGFEPQVLCNANIPVLQAYNLYVTEEKWDQNPEGMGITELGTQVILPELDGIVHTLPIAALDPDSAPKRSYIPIFERIEKTVAKARKWGYLRHIEKENKKVVIVLHNYPPKNSNIGTAAGLDTPESLYLLLHAMSKEGYRIGNIPNSSKELMEMILSAATNDRRYITEHQIKTAVGKMEDGQYIRFFTNLPSATKERMENDWGEAPGEVFHYDDFLLIPGIEFGNVFVTVQPPRGFGENPSAIYHSPDLPPPHHYLAYYEWLRSCWHADAVIHLGTHGSLEWLPGKGTGLSATCYPDISLRDLPDIYPYWITIVGEGIQAKRRGSACLIGHMSPPQTQAELYGKYDELRKKIDEYTAMKIHGGISEEMIAKIREIVAELELLPEEKYNEDIDEWLDIVHECLDDLTYLQIRTGLHILGNVPRNEALNNYLAMLTEVANGEVPSLPEILYNDLSFGIKDIYELRECKARAYFLRNEFIKYLASRHYKLPEIKDIEDWCIANGLTQDCAIKLAGIAEYMVNFLVPVLEKTSTEITNTIRSLDGEYIEPSLGGAPTSGCADILPTGRNFTSADPHGFPTENAYNLGKELAEQALERFIAEEGAYPESIGIILWATSQMRSYGQCLGEILYLLGVKPVWQKGSGRIIDLEVLSPETLARPRIDVTARISGLFRDTMPMSAALIDKAINLVADLDEEPEINYVRKHIEEDIETWTAEGLSKEEAFIEARWRVFGDPPGAYGTGIGKVLECKNWEGDDDLAQVYTTWSGYAFRPEERATDAKRAFTRRMSQIRLTIQNADNRESHLLNSDDYNAYHGGMNVTIRALTGNAPMSIMGDTSRRNRAVTRTIAEETDRLVRGEALNPKYIEGMKKHGYKGAQELANYISHLYQWDATTDVATDWMYERISETYVFDKEMRDWFREENPWAFERMAEVLLEAMHRGLWSLNEEYKEKLSEILLETEGDLEDIADNKFSNGE